MKIDLGKIKITWKGNYDENVQYEKDDAVFYRNSSYIFVAKDAATGISPAEYKSNSTWDLMSRGTMEMSTQGEIIFHGSQGNKVLASGPEGFILTSGGNNKDITWKHEAGQHNVVQKLPNMHCHTGSDDSYGVIMADGTIRMCGHNNYGQLGLGMMHSRENLSSPTVPYWDIGDLRIIKWEMVGYNNICLLSDGSVFCWGRNKYGCLGLGMSRPYLYPQKVQFPDNTKIVDFSFGQDVKSIRELNHSMFLSDAGKLFAVGYNASGQLGVNMLSNLSSPYSLPTSNWSSVLCLGGRKAYTLGIDKEKKLWVWGDFDTNLSDFQFQNAWRISLPNSCKQISASSGGHMLALLEDGRVYGWGNNEYGQLGLGHTACVKSPQYISDLGSDNVRVWAWGDQNGSSIVQKQDGTLRLFGSNQEGQLGGNMSSTSAKTMSLSPMSLRVLSKNRQIKQILPIGESGGKLALCILFTDGTIMVTGYNARNNLNLGHLNFQSDFCELKMMKHKPIALCAIGKGLTCSFGVLTDNGLYYQSVESSGYRAKFAPVRF